MLLLLTSLSISAFGGLELILVRKKNWWKDMAFLDTPLPPPLFTRINKFILSRAHRGPNIQEQLSNWWLPASLREIWPKSPLSSLYLVPNMFFQKFWKIFFSTFGTLCLSHFHPSPFFIMPCQISSAQTIWICEHLPIHHLFWLELHILFSPTSLWNAVNKKKPSTPK